MFLIFSWVSSGLGTCAFSWLIPGLGLELPFPLDYLGIQMGRHVMGLGLRRGDHLPGCGLWAVVAAGYSRALLQLDLLFVLAGCFMPA